MKRKIRKWIYSIFLLLLVSMSVSFGADTYYYFSGNGKNNNGFQQGCEEYYYVYYNLDGMDGITTTNIVVQLDNNDLHYYTGVLATGLQQNLFRKNNDVASSFTAGYPKWKNQFNKIDISTNFLSTAPNNTYLGYFIFKPTYRNGSYNSNVYLLWHDNDISLGKGGNNMVSYSEQVQHLTGTIPVKQSPCVDDGQSPRIINVNYTNGSSHIDRKKLEFDIKDDNTTQVGTGAVPYIWNKNGQNLVWTSHNNQNINNQIGVLDTTVTVKVTGKGLDGTSYTNRNANVTCNGKGILAWTGGWERDYGCEVTAADLLPQEFGVEEPITITISGKDRLNHQTGTSIIFNSPVQPDIKDWTLTNGVYPNKNDNSNRYGIDSQIRFTVKDDWAGVDSGSIVVKITGTGGYSKIFTGNIDTGNISLTISNGSEGKGHAAWYDVVVTLTPDEYLPVDDKITVNVSFKDFVNQTRSRSRYFYTRKSCAALGCCDGTEIYTGFENSHISFTGEELFISGGNNIEVTTGNITYFGNIFTGGVLINCNYVGLTLFKGTPENNPTEVASVPYNRLVFTGGDNVVKGVLSGNVLTLKYYVQDTNVNIISPNVGNGLSGEYLVDDNGYTTTGIFTWELADGTDSSQWLSGYDFVVYSGNEFGNDEVYSGRIYTTGTTISFTGSEYVRGVRAVDNQGNTGEWATGSFKIKYRLNDNDTELILITPSDNASFVDNKRVTFEWNLSGGVGVSDVIYSLYIISMGQNWGEPVYTGTLTGTSISLDDNGTYQWKVIVTDGIGNEIVSDVREFIVDVNKIVGQVNIDQIGPIGVLNTGNTALEWTTNDVNLLQGEGEFSGFVIQISSGNMDCNDVVDWGEEIRVGMSISSYPLEGLETNNYCWKIWAEDRDSNTSAEYTTGFSVLLEQTYTVKVYPYGRSEGGHGYADSGWIRILKLNTGEIYTGYLLINTGVINENTNELEFSGLNIPEGAVSVYTITGNEKKFSFEWSADVLYRGYLSKHDNAYVNVELPDGIYLVSKKDGIYSFNVISSIDDIYSGHVLIQPSGIGTFTGLIQDGIYTISYKGQSSLASYLLQNRVDSSTVGFDFTTGSTLFGTFNKQGVEYQIQGDLVNSLGEFDGIIEIGDSSAMISRIQKGNRVVSADDHWNRYNLDGDSEISSLDLEFIFTMFPTPSVDENNQPVLVPMFDAFNLGHDTFTAVGSGGFMRSLSWISF